MAKKLTVNIAEKRINSYLKGVDAIYRIAILEVSNLVSSLNYDSSKPFTWNSYPQTKAKIDKVIHSLFNSLNVTITDATTKEWLEACIANDNIVKKFLNNPKLKAIATDHYYQRNLEALDAFQKRKASGLNLSKRVWNMSQQFKNELEMCIDVGLSEGRSASELSRDIRHYLNEPNKLYRKVQNSQNGKFYLSINAKKYNPGTGLYRSSYKNAMRVTRTETNMAYRASDLERWNQLDFVIGYEVRRSNNVFCCKVCEALVGVYPKWFKFQGWHPQCYDELSEVLTNRGWQYFKDVRNEDLILSLNPDTKDLEWTSILLNFKREHRGKMIHFTNKTLDCLVTPEHEMIYANKSNGKIKRCQAIDYTKGKGAFYRSSEWNGKELDVITIGKTDFKFDVFCEFMGYWLSDGSLIRDSQIKIAQSITDINRRAIETCLTKLGINVGGTEYSVDCYSKDLNNYLRQFGKAYNKFIPSEIKNSSPRQIQIFLNAFISCDGSTRKRNKSFIGNRGTEFTPKVEERLYYTTSPQMASDIGELILKIGKRPSYYTDRTKGKDHKFPNGTYTMNYDLIKINECQGKTATVFKKEIVSYNGFVYDLTLMKNSIMYIRRNGKCFWGSNCRCYAVPVLAKSEDFIAAQKRLLSGDNSHTNYKQIESLPPSFVYWVKSNSSRIASASKKPYFLKDNFSNKDLSKGLRYLR